MKARITIEASFVRALKMLPPDRQKASRNALERFMMEPALPGLRFRPLERAQGYFILSAAHGDRIILRKDDENLYAAVDIGPHDNVYRRWNRR